MRISDWSSDVCSSDLSTSPVRAPARRPCAIVAAGAVSAAATDTDPVSIAAPNSAAITKCRIAPSYPSRPAAGGRGRERDLERNASFDADDARLAVPVDRRRLRDEINLVEDVVRRSEEHTSELQSLMRISYAVFCLKKKK